MATAEFSKFAGILSAALSQRHLSRFEIGQLFAWGGQSTGLSALASFLPKIKDIKGIQIGKEDVKLFPIPENMILYIEKP